MDKLFAWKQRDQEHKDKYNKRLNNKIDPLDMDKHKTQKRDIDIISKRKKTTA